MFNWDQLLANTAVILLAARRPVPNEMKTGSNSNSNIAQAIKPPQACHTDYASTHSAQGSNSNNGLINIQ
jgi:hypothetical protein